MNKILALLTLSLAMCSFAAVRSKTMTVKAEECICLEHVIPNKENELISQPDPAYAYQNVCWRCHSNINSNVNSRCSRCGWYICKRCGACDSACSRCPSWNGGGTGSSSSSTKSNNNTWVWILAIAGIGVGGYFLYKKFNEK